jgi:hypothetical protein
MSGLGKGEERHDDNGDGIEATIAYGSEQHPHP